MQKLSETEMEIEGLLKQLSDRRITGTAVLDALVGEDEAAVLSRLRALAEPHGVRLRVRWVRDTGRRRRWG